MARAVPMIDYIKPPPPPPPQSSDRPNSNLPTLYHGLLVVGAAAIVLAVYNLIIIKWCATRRRQQRARQRPNNGFIEATTTTASDQSFDNNIIMNRNLTLLSSFTYHKKEGDDNYEHECAVCLSVFEEGEEVRRLPRCKHSFHVSCIDMWLYSHFDCPLCRTPINQVTRCGLQIQVDHSHESQEHSTEILLASGISRQT